MILSWHRSKLTRPRYQTDDKQVHVMVGTATRSHVLNGPVKDPLGVYLEPRAVPAACIIPERATDNLVIPNRTVVRMFL
jgi:hypothetical protein